MTVTGGNVGAVKNIGSAAHIKFEYPGVQQYGPSGTPLNIAETVFDFKSSSDWGTDINGSVVSGTLWKIGEA